MTTPSQEALLVGASGAALGAVVGRVLVGGRAGALLGGVVGGVNGVVSGARSVYDWRSPSGVVAFLLDSTWSLGNTAAGLMSHALGAVPRDPGYVASLSARQNRHVYRRGFRPRAGFAITLGNVVSGAGDTDAPRRAQLVTDHEDVHVWQARWFGPAYPVLYLSWMVGGAVVGTLLWLRGRRERSWWRTVESCAYYLCPFEWWAYSRDGNWRPPGLVAGLGWQRPIVRSFGARRADGVSAASGV